MPTRHRDFGFLHAWNDWCGGGQVLDRLFPSIPVLIVALYITDQLVAEAKSVGIKGAAPKSDTREIINGVEALMQKNTFFKETYQV